MYADQETGLYYNWFRYYDPKIGGYTTVEPLGIVPGVASSAMVPREITQYFQSIPLNERLVRGLNQPYRYAYNNPLTYIDPDGLMGRGAGGGKSMPGPLRFGGGGATPIGSLGDMLSGPNGNMWGEPKRQDNVCSLGPVLGKIADACVLDRCQRHDNCYAANQCTASSWASSALGGTKSCNQCNSGFFK